MDEYEQRKRDFLKRHPQLDRLVDRLLRGGDEDVRRVFQRKEANDEAGRRKDR